LPTRDARDSGKVFPGGGADCRRRSKRESAGHFRLYALPGRARELCGTAAACAGCLRADEGAISPRPKPRSGEWAEVVISWSDPPLLPEVHATEQHICHSRLRPGSLPSAMRPCAAGLGPRTGAEIARRGWRGSGRGPPRPQSVRVPAPGPGSHSRPSPFSSSGRPPHLDIRRHQRLGEILNEYRHAA
jgi:hypothetical protein